ncbi:MAG: exonuclease domain-containing protein [Clostridia bacterium]
MKKFDEEFKKITNNKYPYLRFLKAEYSLEKKLLCIYFLIRYDMLADKKLANDKVNKAVFNDNDIKDVLSFCSKLLPNDIKITASFSKAYADVELVRSKVIECLSKNESFLSTYLTVDDIDIIVDDYYIKVTITSFANVISILSDPSLKSKLENVLLENFVENIDIEYVTRVPSATEKKQINQNIKKNIEKMFGNRVINVTFDNNGINQVELNSTDNLNDVDDTEMKPNNITLFLGSHQVDVNVGEPIYGSGYPFSRPTYISDSKEPQDNAVICGKVSRVNKFEYLNKNFGQVDGKKTKYKINTTDEKLVRYCFNLNDTTGTLPIICFPKVLNNEKLNKFLKDDAEVICSGKLKKSDNNFDILQMYVDKIWLAEIDFSTINTAAPIRTENSSYQKVVPEKYREIEQADISEFIDREKESSTFLKSKTFVVFDFETTGLDVKTVSIVQIGAVKISDGRIVETFSSYVNPMCHIPEESTNIHKITDDMVLSAPEFENILPDFFKFSRGAVLVGHNIISYDLPILYRYAKSYGYKFDNDVMDTLVLAQTKLRLPKNNLTAVCKYFDVSIENAHQAIDDALATAKCFLKLAELL